MINKAQGRRSVGLLSGVLTRLSCSFRPGRRHVHRGTGVRQLRLRVHAAVAPGRHRPLPVQRLRPVPQDERRQQAAHQAAETTGERQREAHAHARAPDHDRISLQICTKMI